MLRLPVTDVVVVGAGGAGLRAAITVAERGLSVTVLERGVPRRSGNTPIGAYSVCAALGYADPRDNPEVHFQDTMRSGQGVNNGRMAWVYACEAPQRVLEVDAWGARFDRNGDRLVQDMMPGHTYPRACHADRRSGQAIMVGLRARARCFRNITLVGDTVALDLVLVDGIVAGVVGYRLRDNEYVLLPARAVILATGGAGQLYRQTTTAAESTGDGMAMAYRAGAELVDMEFVQFYPVAQCYPRLAGLGPTATHFLRLRTGARLYNALGEDFMDKVMPDWRFKATRDVLARAVYREVREGRGSPHGGVYISVAHLPPEVVEREYAFGGYFQKMLELGVDLRRDALETTVACHYFMGGIRTDEWGRTSVAGLFAAGEVAGGVDGANRLGGNALSSILVFGHRAGVAASDHAREVELPGVSRLESAARQVQADWGKRLGGKGGVRPGLLKDRIREVMWSEVAVIRTGQGLDKAIGELEEVRELASRGLGVVTGARAYDREVMDAIDVNNMSLVAEVVARAARERSESRGSHYREDFPVRDDAKWLANLVVVPGPTPRLVRTPVVPRDEGSGNP